MPNYVQILELFGVVILISICAYLFIRDFKKWVNLRQNCGEALKCAFQGYLKDRPETWPVKFDNASGCCQSPINIKTKYSMVMPRGTYTSLMFNRQYFIVPKSMTVANDGYGILLGTCFEEKFPTISGGPLSHQYRFNLAQFKWGPTDYEGSEHTINSKRYAMELQLMHIKGDTMYENLDCAAQCQAVLFISYFFQITPMDNPYLEPIIDSLQCVKYPNQQTKIHPFPLCWLFHPFKSRYYYYQGSITCPPCTEGADWIIQAEPLSISQNQLRIFRTLMAIDGIMKRNTRPVQLINNRTVYFFE